MRLSFSSADVAAFTFFFDVLGFSFLGSLLSPVVVDSIAVKREDDELNADVSHLEVHVLVSHVEVVLALGFKVGTPASLFTPVIVDAVLGVEII